MKFNENLWHSLKTDETQWKTLKLIDQSIRNNGIVWNPMTITMKINVQCKKINGMIWTTMKSNENLWKTMKFLEHQWTQIKINDQSMRINETP